MNKLEKSACIIGVATLCETLPPHRVATDTMQRAYQLGLDGLTAEQISASVGRALRACKFLPSPAELRELAGELPIGERAELAWLEFSQAVSRIGCYKSVDFRDSIVNAVVRSLGGWQACCSMDADKFDSFLRRDFLKTYQAFSRSRPSEESCGHLPGIHESARSPSMKIVKVGSGEDTARIATEANKPSGILELKKI